MCGSLDGRCWASGRGIERPESLIAVLANFIIALPFLRGEMEASYWNHFGEGFIFTVIPSTMEERSEKHEVNRNAG